MNEERLRPHRFMPEALFHGVQMENILILILYQTHSLFFFRLDAVTGMKRKPVRALNLTSVQKALCCGEELTHIIPLYFLYFFVYHIVIPF